MVVILRYLKTPLFESFYVFIHPFVLVLTAYLIYHLYMFKKGIGMLVFVTVIGGTLITNWQHIQSGENITHMFASTWSHELKQKFPGEKFAVYDYEYKYRDKSFPLVLYLMSEDMIDDNGKRIGIAVTSKEVDHSETYQSIIGNTGSYQVFDLEASSSSQLRGSKWSFVNPSQVYKSTQSWYTLEE